MQRTRCNSETTDLSMPKIPAFLSVFRVVVDPAAEILHPTRLPQQENLKKAHPLAVLPVANVVAVSHLKWPGEKGTSNCPVEGLILILSERPANPGKTNCLGHFTIFRAKPAEKCSVSILVYKPLSRGSLSTMQGQDTLNYPISATRVDLSMDNMP